MQFLYINTFELLGD